MTRIDSIFARLRAEGRTALMPFLTAGDPSLEVTAEAVAAVAAAGAGVVELGIPYSDPIADGPVIAESMHRALTAGVTPAAVLGLARRLRPRTDLGLVAMVSHSIVQRLGPGRFVAEAADAGFDGLIVPDVDLDAAGELRDLAGARDLAFSLLIAPTTGPERLGRIAGLCLGFVYLLARGGLTGERQHLPPIAERVAAVRAATGLPVAAGFGISTREQVRAATRHADAAIVGSALVRRMHAAADPVAEVRAAVEDLAAGLHRT